MPLDPIRTQGSEPQRGMVFLHTGNGKGKSTSAVGLMIRVLGRGLGHRVGCFQFARLPMERCGEYHVLAQLGVSVVGLGCSDARGWKVRHPDNAEALVGQVWAQAKKVIEAGETYLVVLDDMGFALANGWVSLSEVMTTLAQRPTGVNVCLTGRRFPPELVELADSVVKMSALKQPLTPHVAVQRPAMRPMIRLN